MSAGPPVEVPVGDITVTGTVTSPERTGETFAALLPLGTALPATSPCVPDGAKRVWVNPTTRKFVMPEVAPNQYELMLFHFSVNYQQFERTLRTVTITASTTDLGTFALPAKVTARAEAGGKFGPGGEEEDRVKWAAPNGFSTTAYDVSYGSFLCSSGTPLTVQGNYEVDTDEVQVVKVVVESPELKQMAIHTLSAD